MSRKTKIPKLMLHDLIGALSYWGTTVRILLVGFVLLLANLLVILDSSVSHKLTEYVAQYLYLLGSLFVLDAGYVTIARPLPLKLESVDKLVFFIAYLVMAGLIVIPYFVIVSPGVLVGLRWVLLISLFILSLRLVVGFFYGKSDSPNSQK